MVVYDLAEMAELANKISYQKQLVSSSAVFFSPWS